MAVNFLAFKGAEGDQRIFLSTFDGNSWTGLSPLDGANSSHGPALAVFNGQLHMVWRGMEGDQRLFQARVGGRAWSKNRSLSPVRTAAMVLH